MPLTACSAYLCSPVDFLNSTVSLSLPRFIRAAFLLVSFCIGLYRAHFWCLMQSCFAGQFSRFAPSSNFRLDKRDERRGPAPRVAERGDNLQRLPAPKAAGEVGHDLLLANPSQPRLYNLRRVDRFGFVEVSGDDVVRSIADLALVGAVSAPLLGIRDKASLFGHEPSHRFPRERDRIVPLSKALSDVPASASTLDNGELFFYGLSRFSVLIRLCRFGFGAVVAAGGQTHRPQGLGHRESLWQGIDERRLPIIARLLDALCF